MDIVKHELFLLLEEEELKNVPLVILANKQDINGCLTDIEVNYYNTYIILLFIKQIIKKDNWYAWTQKYKK